MNCKCSTRIGNELKSKNLRLVGYALVMPDLKAVPCIATEWIDKTLAPKGKRSWPPSMLASHCPFCGKPVAEPSKRQPMTTPFNWLTALEQACKEEPSLEEHAALRRKARSWPLCACGELCKSLPRHGASTSPRDSELRELGQCFCVQVEGKNWPAALATFHAIEARTSLLLAQGGANA